MESSTTTGSLPSVGRLLNLLRKDPTTGELLWRTKRGRAKAGDVAGNINSKGYRKIRVDGKLYLAHRLAYVMEHGTCPEILDHENGDKLNNVGRNLRPANRSQNGQNAKRSRRNKSGIKGVSWSNTYNKWVVFLRVDGKNRNLGYFKELEDAATKITEARNTHHGEFANHG